MQFVDYKKMRKERMIIFPFMESFSGAVGLHNEIEKYVYILEKRYIKDYKVEKKNTVSNYVFVYGYQN